MHDLSNGAHKSKLKAILMDTRFNFGSADPSKVVQFSVGNNTCGNNTEFSRAAV